MFNKILVIWWIALSSILVIENMVIPNTAYFFIDNSSTSWFVALASTLIWVAIGYWLAWMRKKDDIDSDDLDF